LLLRTVPDNPRAVAAAIAPAYPCLGAGPVGQPSPDTSPPPSGLPRAEPFCGGGAVFLRMARTKSCNASVIVQHAGRLWRHARGQRPFWIIRSIGARSVTIYRPCAFPARAGMNRQIRLPGSGRSAFAARAGMNRYMTGATPVLNGVSLKKIKIPEIAERGKGEELRARCVPR
jgi:hypothetical protein